LQLQDSSSQANTLLVWILLLSLAQDDWRIRKPAA
jgi:hypothetical protein